MGSGTKRAADDSTSATTSPRGSKAQKTEKNSDAKNNGKKTARKSSTTQPPLSATDFKSKALPLHVNLTHTPPSILRKVESDTAVAGGSELEDVPEVDSAVVGNDIGFIESLTLLPSSFSTGSYGWKGSKRITVELQGGGGNDEGEGSKEKVQVMLSINATVIGSKPGRKAGKKKAEEDCAEEEDETD